MARSGNSGKGYNADDYRDNDAKAGSRVHLGEDVQMGSKKSMYRKRLVNEIDDNAYEQDLEIEITDDPKHWGKDLQVNFEKKNAENYAKNLKKYVRIIKKLYKWLQEDPDGQVMTSVVGVRSKIGMVKKTWDLACDNSEEFEYYSDLIREMVGARISDLGMHNSQGQIFKIFSIKNILPDEYADKKEVSTHERIEVIQISQGSKGDIKELTEKSIKRLKK